MLCHRGEPLLIDYFDILVEEKKPWRIGRLCSVIPRCRIIWRARELQKTNGKTCQATWRVPGVAAVDDENLVIRVACFHRQIFNTSLQRLFTINIRNDDGNF